MSNAFVIGLFFGSLVQGLFWLYIQNFIILDLATKEDKKEDKKTEKGDTPTSLSLKNWYKWDINQETLDSDNAKNFIKKLNANFRDAIKKRDKKKKKDQNAEQNVKQIKVEDVSSFDQYFPKDDDLG